MRWTRMSVGAVVAVLVVALGAASAFGRSAPPVPVIEQPADDPHHQREATVVLSGTTASGVTVALYEGDARLDELVAVDGTWRFEVAGVAVGQHVYGVRAEDGIEMSDFLTRTVVIDPPPAPAIETPDDGAVLVRRATEIGGAAEAGAEVVVRDGGTELGRAAAGAGGAWSLTASLDRGEHVLTAEAVDSAGNHSERSAPVAARVASVTIASDRTPFAFTATPVVPLTCRIVHPGGRTDDAACATSYDVPDLPPGTYRFVVFPAGGDEALGDSRTFVVAAPPPPPPPPVPLPQPAPAPAPRVIEIPAPVPALRQTVVLRPVSGKILVRRPGTASSLALAATEAVPLGATIDARHGRVRITAARRGTRPPQRAEFSGGVFVVTQRRSLVDLRLTEKRTRRCARRRLAGEGRGNFRISGRYATATARGTTWLVQDSCRGTRVRVKQGVVAVRDKVRRRTVLVHPRKPYLARAKKRR